jgi:hypothetical protein
MSELYKFPSKFTEPDLGSLEANKIMLVLKLALGDEYMNRVYKVDPNYIKEKYPYLDRKDKDKFYKLLGELVIVFGQGPAKVREAISMFEKTYNFAGDLGVPPAFIGLMEIIIAEPFSARNVMLGSPFLLEQAPTVEELKLLADLNFEMGIYRLKNSGRWLAILGAYKAEHPPTAEEIKELVGEEDEIYVSLHNHPPSVREPREPSDNDMKDEPGEIRFVISRFGLTLYDETGVIEYIPWEKVTLSLYDPP